MSSFRSLHSRTYSIIFSLSLFFSVYSLIFRFNRNESHIFPFFCLVLVIFLGMYFFGYSTINKISDTYQQQVASPNHEAEEKKQDQLLQYVSASYFENKPELPLFVSDIKQHIISLPNTLLSLYTKDRDRFFLIGTVLFLFSFSSLLVSSLSSWPLYNVFLSFAFFISMFFLYSFASSPSAEEIGSLVSPFLEQNIMLAIYFLCTIILFSLSSVIRIKRKE